MKTPSSTIVFIVMSLSQPRCIKRVSSIAQAGYDCVVYGYKRGLYDVNSFPEGITVHDLGEMRNGEGLANLRIVRKDIGKIIRKFGSNSLYYSFGILPSLLLARAGVNYIYEISDIPYAYPKYKRITWLLRKIDKRIVTKSALTVMTSGGFYNYLGIKDEKIIVQPNRVSSIFKGMERTPMNLSAPRFRFAFVGAIRYNTVLIFAQIIGEEFPQYEFHFYGGGSKERLEQVSALTEKHPNIQYHGTFKNPDDLNSIYKSIDIVVACYDVSSQNERIAEPNKLYESLCFCRPIIVSGGTYLAERVRELQCGFVLDDHSRDSISNLIKQIDVALINDISRRESLLDEKEYMDDVYLLAGRIRDVVCRYSRSL